MSETKVITRNKPSDQQALSDYFQGEAEIEDLTDHQRERLDRVRTVHAAWLDMKDKQTILRIMADTFGLSEAQAYRDINLTHFLYGNLTQSNKEMDRQRSKQMAVETYNLAYSLNDTKGMAAANKNFSDAAGILKDDPDLPDFSKLEQNIYVIIADPTTQALSNKLLETEGPLNLSKFLNEQAEDVEFTSIPNGADSGADSETP